MGIYMWTVFSNPHPAVFEVPGGGRARRFVCVPANLDGFETVHNIVDREPDWLRRRSIFVPLNLLGGSNLFTPLARDRDTCRSFAGKETRSCLRRGRDRPGLWDSGQYYYYYYYYYY